MNFYGLKHQQVFILISAIGIVLSILLESRALVIGYIFSTIGVAHLAGYFDNKSRRIKVVLGILPFASLFILMTVVKSDSSRGRLLILKICSEILNDHLLVGVGWNRFGWTYRNYQARYFQKGNYTTKDLLLADNTQYAFNDYLQFVIEFGIVGYIILLVVITLIISLVKIAIKKNEPTPLLLTALSQLIALSIAALFTHIFPHLHFQLLFIISLSIVTLYTVPRHLNKLVLYCQLIIISCVILINFKSRLANWGDYQDYSQALQLYKTGYINESEKIYSKVYPALRNDAKFLNDYANLLSSTFQEARELQILERLVDIDNSYSYCQRLADVYKKNKYFLEAEYFYVFAVNTVPNKFSSRFKLFNFYLETMQTNKALNTGLAILTLPVKIPSQEVNYIKKEVTDRLKALK